VGSLRRRSQRERARRPGDSRAEHSLPSLTQRHGPRANLTTLRQVCDGGARSLPRRRGVPGFAVRSPPRDRADRDPHNGPRPIAAVGLLGLELDPDEALAQALGSHGVCRSHKPPSASGAGDGGAPHPAPPASGSAAAMMTAILVAVVVNSLPWACRWWAERAFTLRHEASARIPVLAGRPHRQRGYLRTLSRGLCRTAR
jgi:hypothetical protein